jgi:hypothetical protein
MIFKLLCFPLNPRNIFFGKSKNKQYNYPLLKPHPMKNFTTNRFSINFSVLPKKLKGLVKSLLFFSIVLISILFLCSTSNLLFAKQVNIHEANMVARSFLISKGIGEDFEIKTIEILEHRDMNNISLAFFIALEPYGYLVLSGDDRIEPVISYSFTSYLNQLDEESPLFGMVYHDMMLRMEAMDKGLVEENILAQNNRKWIDLKKGNIKQIQNEVIYPPTGTTVTGGWIETQWGQDDIYNEACPMDPITNIRSVTGCVATAMAQIVNYWGTSTGLPVAVTFANSNNYTSQIDPNDGNGTRTISINAPSANISNLSYPLAGNDIASLMYACGVSVNMNYSSAGSGAITSNVRNALLTRFNFATAIEKNPAEDDEFYQTLSDNMINGLPAQLAIRTTHPQGNHSHHSIICDGFNESDNTYHLNFGWEGLDDNWYSLPDGMPAGYNVVKYGILDIINETAGITDVTANLLLNQQGIVEVKCIAPRNGTYRIRVTHENGYFSPGWDWDSNTSDEVELLAGEEHTFELYVTPTSESKGFVFKLGRKRILNQFTESDRMLVYLYILNTEEKFITDITSQGLLINNFGDILINFVPPAEGEYRVRVKQNSKDPKWNFSQTSNPIVANNTNELTAALAIRPTDGFANLEFSLEKKTLWGLRWRRVGSKIDKSFYARHSQQNDRPPYPILMIHGWAGNKFSWEHERHSAGNWIDYFTNLGWNFGGIIPFTLDYNNQSLHDEAYSDVAFLENETVLYEGDFYTIDFDYHRSGRYQPGVNFRFKNIDATSQIIELHWTPFYKNDPYQISVGDLLVTGSVNNREVLKVIEAYYANGKYKVIRGYDNTIATTHISETDERGDDRGVLVVNHSSLSNQASLVKQGIAVKMAIEKIKQLTGCEKVVLLCHSMGGLAARQYVQTEEIYSNDVANIITISTPHHGSNTSDFSELGFTHFSKFNLDSDAVRDLRYHKSASGTASPSMPDYPNENDNATTLYGGLENDPWSSGFDWFSFDFDGDGNPESSINITGLNSKPWPQEVLIHAFQFRRPLPYFLIYGDDIVRFDRQIPSHVVPANNLQTTEVVMNPQFDPIFNNSFNYFILHQVSRYQIDKIMMGLDEPDDFSFAYKVSINTAHKLNGFVNEKGSGITQDIDWFKFQPSKDGLIKVGITGINKASNQWSLQVINEDASSVQGAYLNHSSTSEEITFLANSENSYYLKIVAIATNQSYKYPYSFHIEEVGLEVKIIEPYLGSPVIVDFSDTSNSFVETVVSVKDESGNIIPNLTLSDFSASIGLSPASISNISFNNNQYYLSLIPPAQNSMGLYNLSISVSKNSLSGVANLSAGVLYTNQVLIEKGLAWLRTQQHPTGGYWTGYSSDRVGATALALQAFLAAGYSPIDDQTVQKGITYLLSQTQGNGGIYNWSNQAGYQCAMAITALRSAVPFNPPNIDAINIAITNAQNYYINRQQTTSGGWRYTPHSSLAYDLSVSQWPILALQGVDNATLWNRVRNNLLSNSYCRHSNGGYRYTASSSPTGTMTCAGIWGEIISGGPQSKIDAGFDWLKNNNGGTTQGIVNAYHNNHWTYYYLYSLAKACALSGKTQLFGENWYEMVYNRIDNQHLSASKGEIVEEREFSIFDFSPGEMPHLLPKIQFDSLLINKSGDRSNPMAYWTNPYSSYENNTISTAFALLSLQVGTVPYGSKVSISLTTNNGLRNECIELTIFDESGNSAGQIDGVWYSNIPNSEWVSVQDGYYELVVYLDEACNFSTQIVNNCSGVQDIELSFKAYIGNNVADEENFTFEVNPDAAMGATAFVNAIGGLNVIITQPPGPIPLMLLQPNTLVYKDIEINQTYSFNFWVKETGSETPLSNIDIFASSLTDEYGNVIPASSFTFAPNTIAQLPAGDSAMVQVTFVTPASFPNPEIGLFQGTITAQTNQQARAFYLKIGCLRDIELSARPHNGGTVSINKVYSQCNKQSMVTAVPAPGYQFVNWVEYISLDIGEDCHGYVEVSKDPAYVFNVTDDRILTANFAPVFQASPPSDFVSDLDYKKVTLDWYPPQNKQIEESLVFRFDTDKREYFEGEPIHMYFSITNTSSQDTVLEFSSNCKFLYYIPNVFPASGYWTCGSMMDYLHVPANETVHYEDVHLTSNFALSPGMYNFEGHLDGHFVLEKKIAILPASAPKLSFDFYTNKPSYYLGDTITINYAVTNHTNQNVILEFCIEEGLSGNPDAFCHWSIDYTFYGPDCIYFGMPMPMLVVVPITIPANETVVWSKTLDLGEYYINDPGTYNLYGHLSISNECIVSNPTAFFPQGFFAGNTKIVVTDNPKLLGYNIYRDGVKLNPDILLNPQYVDFDVNLGSTHEYFVKAVYESAESIASNTIVVNTSCLKPVDLNAQQYNTANVQISWQPPSAVGVSNKKLELSPVYEFDALTNLMNLPIEDEISTKHSRIIKDEEIENKSRNQVVLHYDGNNAGAIGLTAGGTFYVAAHFPSLLTSQYPNYVIESVDVFVGDLPTSSVLRISSPAAILHEQSFTPVANSWNTILLSNDILVTGDSLLVSIKYTHAAGATPAGFDTGPANVNGDWMSFNGTQWFHLGIGRNFNIRANLTPYFIPVNNYQVFRDDVYIGQVSGQTLQFIDGPLTSGIYSYKVRSMYPQCQSDFSVSVEINLEHNIQATSSPQYVAIFSGQNKCFEAIQTITVGGNEGHFIVLPGGSAKLVAGKNIVFLPNTIIQSNSYLHAFISKNGLFCFNPPSMLENLDEESTVAETIPVIFETAPLFQLYPNPTTDVFTLEFTSADVFSKAIVEIYSLMGDIVGYYELSGAIKHEFDLTKAPSGIYLVRVISGNEIGVQRIIKR